MTGITVTKNKGFTQKGEIMTHTGTKLFDNEISVFSEKDKQEMPVIQEVTVEVKIRKVKIDVEKRFSRLRKNLRKRSVSIF